MNYNEPLLTLSDVMNLLDNRGMVFEDKQKAGDKLRNLSLFRLKGYLYPFEQDHNTHQLKPDTIFEQVLNLYDFDVSLRAFVLHCLQKIEVSLRTQLSQVMAEATDQFWHTNPVNFRDASQHATLLAKLSSELKRSDDDQILAFRRIYSNPYPPCWMSMEIMTFGTLSLMYKYLKAGNSRRDVANYYGLPDTVMESWIHSLVYVRNICAHHSRLWNRTLRIQPVAPRRPHHPFISRSALNNRVYYVLCIIKYLLGTIEPSYKIETQLARLWSKYPMIDKRAMGFPNGWELEPFWQSV